MKASFSSTVDSVITEKIKKLQRKADDGARDILNMIVSDTDEYVPYRTGALAQNVSIDEGDISISYNQPYAEYIYKNRSLNFNTEVHEKATAYWVKHSTKANKGKWLKALDSRIGVV